MKASFLLSIAAVLATAVSAIPQPDARTTKDLDLQDDLELETAAMEFAGDFVSETELSKELELAEDVDFGDEMEDDVDAFGRRRRRCIRHCRRNLRHCRTHPSV